MRINIKPLSVNEAFKGRRFKTDQYKNYELNVMMLLRNMQIPAGELELSITAGFSTRAADIDNIAKPFIDILQRRYDFNDNRIWKLVLNKRIVKKGSEYIEFSIEGIDN